MQKGWKTLMDMLSMQTQAMAYWVNFRLTPNFSLEKLFESLGGMVIHNSDMNVHILTMDDYDILKDYPGYKFVVNMREDCTPKERLLLLSQFYLMSESWTSEWEQVDFATAVNMPKQILFEEIAKIYDANSRLIQNLGDLTQEEFSILCKKFGAFEEWMNEALDRYVDDFKEWYEINVMAEECITQEQLENIVNLAISAMDTKFAITGPRVRNLAKVLGINLTAEETQSRTVLGKICDFLLDGKSNSKERELFTDMVLNKLAVIKINTPYAE